MVRAMKSLALPNRRTIQSLLALGLVMWWGGLNCLVGCLAMSDRAQAAEPETCPMAGHSCCKTPVAQGETNSEPSAPMLAAPVDLLDCCALQEQAAEPTPASAKNSLMHICAKAAVPQFSAVVVAQPIHSFHPRSYLPDRSDTRLRCCVFLI